MVFQPTSPTRGYSDYRRAVQIKRKRTLSAPKSEKASIGMASPPPDRIPEHSEATLKTPAAAPGKASAQNKSAGAGGLARSGSLSDRLRSSWKGGVSSLLKKSQDNVRADAMAKARKSKDTKSTTSGPSSDASQANANPKSKPKEPVEAPASSKPRKGTNETTHTTNSSVLDPSYSPNSKKFRTSDTAPPVPPKSPLGPSQKPQPNSFFEDDSSEEEDESPVLQRASSVHVGKPTLVRHYSNATASQAVKRGHRPAPHTGLSQGDTAEEVNTAEEPRVDKAVNVGNEDLNLPLTVDLTEGPEDALSRLEGSPPKSSGKPLPLTPSTAAPQISPSKAVVASPSTYGSIVTASSDDQATAVISPLLTAATTTSGNHPQGTPFPTPLSPLSALHSNPVSPSTAITGSRLSRALSAPTPPNRNANRRVTIRPSDLVISHSDHDHKLFRDSIVATPYPERGSGGQAKNRLSDIPDGHETIDGLLDDVGDGDTGTLGPSIAEESASTKDHHVTLLDPSTSIPMSPHGPGDRDRFPSLTSSESFLLTLSIAGHPALTKTIEIEVPSPSADPAPTKATLSLRKHRRKTLSNAPSPSSNSTAPDPFDDAALFAVLRTHYRHLLGPRRLLATRTLHHATPSSPETPLDAASFLAHLRDPSLGANTRNWLLWLRNQQPLSKRASSLFSGPNPVNVNITGGGPGGIHGGMAGIGMSGSLSTSALHSPTMYPRMPFQRSEARNAPPGVVLHFRLNALAIAAAAFASLVVGGVAVVVWVLLGVPGRGVGDGAATYDGAYGYDYESGEYSGLSGDGNGDGDVVREGASYGDWRVDSQVRVLTGLVLGGGVAGGGLLVTGLWVLAGWVLL